MKVVKQGKATDTHILTLMNTQPHHTHLYLAGMCFTNVTEAHFLLVPDFLQTAVR